VLPAERRQAAGPAEDGPPPAAGAAQLIDAPLRSRSWHTTLGILDPGGLAVLTGTRSAGVAAGPTAGPTTGPAAEPDPAGPLMLGTVGYGPRAAELAAELAAQVEAWDLGGQPAIEGLHIDAYPRSGPDEPPAVPGARVMERPGNRFLIYHT
ncbi:MAG: hypothetical protein ACRDOB_05560, partial [Streptosporangiaceae bacterium]